MNCIAIIQARMSSARLPRKVMSNLSGEPMIRRIYDLVNKCDYVDKVIVATSLEKTDDELFEYCKSNKLNVYRGSLNNVLSRFVEIIKKYNPKLIVRITGDCPFVYPVFIDKQIKILLQTGADYIISKKEVNILCGQSVHSSSSLLFVAENSSCADDLEHVGSPFLTRNHRKFKVVGIEIPEIFLNSNYRLTVDVSDDLNLAKIIYQNLFDKEPLDLLNVINWLDINKELSRSNIHIIESKINNEIKKQKQNTKYNVQKFFKWDQI